MDLSARLAASFSKNVQRRGEDYYWKRRVKIDEGSESFGCGPGARFAGVRFRDYVRLALPEPEVLRIIGEESKRKGTNRLSWQQIDRLIKAAR